MDSCRCCLPWRLISGNTDKEAQAQRVYVSFLKSLVTQATRCLCLRIWVFTEQRRCPGELWRLWSVPLTEGGVRCGWWNHSWCLWRELQWHHPEQTLPHTPSWPCVASFALSHMPGLLLQPSHPFCELLDLLSINSFSMYSARVSLLVEPRTLHTISEFNPSSFRPETPVCPCVYRVSGSRDWAAAPHKKVRLGSSMIFI